MSKATKPVIVSFYTEGTPYKADADRLAKSVADRGMTASIFPVPDKGDWELNCNCKAAVVRDALKQHPAVLFLDSDCWLKEDIPFFDGLKCDIALDIVRPDRLRVGWFAQRWKHHIYRRGCMWNSGIVYIRRNPRTLELMDRWVEMCARRPKVWDQINLQNAARGMELDVRDIPPDYRAARARIGHRSGFHAHAKKESRPVRRILLLGSAPYITDWWRKRKDVFLDAGWTIAAMNNAWRVPDPDDLDLWLAPNDFDMSKAPPDEIPRNARIRKWTGKEQHAGSWNAQGNLLWRPYWLMDRRVQTCGITLPLHLINECVLDGCTPEIAIAGSDFFYPADGPTHFYGKGTPDPLRFTAQQLRQGLVRLAAVVTKERGRIWNAGEQRDTMLPFLRFPFQ